MGFTRPQLGSYELAKSESDAVWYWLSPSGSTAANPAFTSRSEVYLWWQRSGVPRPPLKNGLEVSQAMSPAAAITGSALAGAAVTASPLKARASVNRRKLD